MPGSPSGQVGAGGAASVPSRQPASWMVLGLACVGQFMVVLDISIVTVALPSMQRSLSFSTSQLQWVVNAYALTFGGFLLLGGRAADLFGRRRVFLFGLGLFSAASLVCAVAETQQTLIAARALQGVGGAVLSPATLTILTTTFREPHERARALGIWSAMAAIGGASGALLGGILTDTLSWRWIFYINLPLGIAAIVVARVVLDETRAEVDRRSLDVLGSIVVTLGMSSLVYAIAGTDVHAWVSTQTLVPLVLALVCFGVFALIETRFAAVPLVPFRLFRSRGLSAANGAMFFVGGAMFSMWLFLSLYLQEVLHFSPLVTGLGFLPQTAAIATAAQISSRLVQRVGPRPPLILGTLLSAIGLFWLSHISPTGTYVTDALGGSVMATFGMGLAFTPLAFAATSGVAREEAGLASGVLNTSRQVGGAICLAALATVVASRSREVAVPGAHSEAARTVALNAGLSRAIAIASVIALFGTFCSLLIPRDRKQIAEARVPERPDAEAPEAVLLASQASDTSELPDGSDGSGVSGRFGPVGLATPGAPDGPGRLSTSGGHTDGTLATEPEG